MPRVMQCLQDPFGSSGFSRAHLTLRARHASQPVQDVNGGRTGVAREENALCDCRLEENKERSVSMSGSEEGERDTTWRS